MRFFVLSLVCGFASGFCVPVSVVSGHCNPNLSNTHIDRSNICSIAFGDLPIENVDKAKNLDTETQALCCNVFLLEVNVGSWAFQDGEQCRFIDTGEEEVFTAWTNHGSVGCEEASAWVTRMSLLGADCHNDHNHAVNGCDEGAPDPACE